MLFPIEIQMFYPPLIPMWINLKKAILGIGILHTDHSTRKLLFWIDGLLEYGERHYQRYGKPLFSSHMLDLSEESIEENIGTCKEYLERMDKLGMTLEIELGVTGGKEDGVDNTEIDNSLLYTQPEEVAYAYEELIKVNDNFTIAASFGNVHGVYKPGNVKLSQDSAELPEIHSGEAWHRPQPG